MYYFWKFLVFKFYWIVVYISDIPGGMPPAAPALLPLCGLGGWISWGGGNGNPEEVSQLHGHQVESILLKDVQIRQE